MLTKARSIVLGALGVAVWALPVWAAPPADSNFQKVILDQNVNNSLVEPLDLEVLPDGRVIYVTRLGQIKIWRPATSTAVVAGQLTLSTQFEDGLSGLVKDPSFATNNYVYMYYMAADVEAARVSRFTLSGDTVNLGSETLVIQWPVRRGGGHTGGGMAFDAAGNLFIASGDNNGATGYAQPLSLDTSANTNDLRGKILRIKPGAAGGYSIPSGNMFAPGTAKTKPEIYAMGFRNPYRIQYDPRRARLLVGNVGPDASADGAEGPRGYDEFDFLDSPGFHGWPMCEANNLNYAGYNCAAPTNNSAGNTGLVTLPAAKPAWIYYYGDVTPAFPQLGSGGRCAFAGPIYLYNASSTSTIKFPAYFDNSLLLMDFSRSKFWETRLNTSGGIAEINQLFGTFPWNAPIAADYGPDGALYILEYAGFFNGSTDTKLARVEYRGAQTGSSPVAQASSNPNSGPVPLTVAFSSAGSNDPDGGAITYAWDFDGNGTTDSTAANPSFTYTAAGSFNARLTVRDSSALTATITIPIVAGNTRPSVNLTAPPEGGFVNWSGSLNYTVSVSDPEDGTINCTRVTTQSAIGHDAHAHPGAQVTGCSGSFAIPASGHSDLDNVWLILSSSYTDLSAPGSAALSNSSTKSYQPKRRQAEHFTTGGGVSITGTGDPSGGLSEVSSIDPNDWIAFQPVNFQNMTGIRYRVGSVNGGTIEVHLDSTTGTLLSTATVPAGQGYINVNGNLSASTGTHTVYFVFKGSGTDLFRMNWIDFLGGGVGTGGVDPTPPPTGCNTTNNIAFGRVATASSAISSPNQAFDASLTTRWESTQGVDPQWIQVDLGTIQSICRVVLNWEAAYATAYQVQVSNNGTAWTNVFTTTTGNGAVDDITGLATAGRYVRMYGTARATGYGYSLFEFEVYAGSGAALPTPTATVAPRGTPTPTTVAPTPTPTTNGTATLLSQGKAVTVSSTENAGTPGSGAVDGNLTGTRWSSAASDPQWIYVDLGATYTISRVVLTWEAAYGTAYQIQTSPNATTWTTIYTTTTGNGATDDLTGLSGSGRYVRMYGTTRATAYGYSLWELQVYGTSGTSATPTFTATATATARPTATPTATTRGTATATTRAASTPTSTARPTPTSTAPPVTNRVLVFSRTLGFRHDSIPAGITMIQNMGAANGFAVDTTEDPTLFNDTTLAQYGAVIWLSTTGDVLDPAQQAAFTRFIQSNKGYVGIHSATDTEYTWPWYGVLAGAYFNGHPMGGQQTFTIQDTAHPSTAGMATTWVRSEAEWYNYLPNPRTNSHILVVLTEPPGTTVGMGADHPISWCKPYDGGRSWYTGMGHNMEAYSEPQFQQHVLGGIRWALGAVAGNCGTAAPTPTPRSTATPTPVGAPACGGPNLALFRVATASSETGASTAGVAFDGDVGTRWESAQGVDPQWVRVDLGSTQSICRVVLNWEAAYATAYQVQTSNDGNAWTNIYTTTAGTGGVQTLSVSGSGRYLRMYGTARATGYGYSLWEMEAYGGGTSATPTPTPRSASTPTATTPPRATPTTAPGTLLSQGKAVTVSSTENAGTPGSSAVDGNLTGTRWSSAASDPQWIYVDLGATYTISRVVLTWEAAYGTAYQIQTSPNATTWTSIYTTTTGNGAADDLTGLTGSGRYVRMYGTARATVWGYSLWELQVYGQ